MRIEAIFLGAPDPETTGRFYADALGLGEPDSTDDGQYTFTTAGVFLAIEPSFEPSTTIWFRTDDLPAALDRLVPSAPPWWPPQTPSAPNW